MSLAKLSEGRYGPFDLNVSHRRIEQRGTVQRQRLFFLCARDRFLHDEVVAWEALL